MIFDVVGKDQNSSKAPVGIFDAIINALAWLGQWNQGAFDARRVGTYWQVLCCRRHADHGALGEIRHHYVARACERIAIEGQEYDPYTTMLGSKPKPASE